jgi:predicted LPLAT superfamily acyltransferase
MKGGRQRAWYRIEETGVVWGMRLLAGINQRFGRAVLAVPLYPVVLWYVATNRVAREASLDYLRRLSMFAPGRVNVGLATCFSHFVSFAYSILDRLSAWTGALTLDDVVFHDRHHLEAALGSGRGVLLVGSHLGCLEVSRAFAGLKPDIRLNALVHTKNAARINTLLAAVNAGRAPELIEVTEITPATAMRLRQRVDAGEVVVVVADRLPVVADTDGAIDDAPAAAGASSVVADFLGAPAAWPQGPWVLAHVLQCPVLTLFCTKLDGKYHIHCEPFADRVELPRRTRVEGIRDLAARFAARLEVRCVETPLQWYNFYPFWLDSSAREGHGDQEQVARRG